MFNKKVLFIIFGTLFFIILLIFSVDSIQIIAFNNTLSSENITFVGDENHTRYLSIPRYANVTSAYMNFSGYSSGWNLSTAVYDNVNISTQDSEPDGLFFKPDGTKLYETGSGGDKIYQYTCSDAWNLNSCSYDNIYIPTQDTSIEGLFFKPDGTKMYEIGRTNNLIYQYTCSDAWNLSSCSYDNINVSVRYLDGTGLFFKPDGTKMYVSEDSYFQIVQYSCSDAWNLSSCSYDGGNIYELSMGTTGLFFEPDGTKLYKIGNYDKISQYTCSDAWNLNSCSYDNIYIPTQDGNSQGLFFKPDGTKMYEIGYDNLKIYQYTLTISYPTEPYLDIGTSDVSPKGTYTGEHWDTAGSGNTDPYGITTNGTYIWVIDSNDGKVYVYDMDGTAITSWDMDGTAIGYWGITTNNVYIWITDYIDDEVYKYWMNGTYTGEHWDTSGETNYARGITTNNVYIWITDAQGTNDEVYKYWMNGTYTGEHWDTAGSGNTAPFGITTDSSYIWITDPLTDKIYKYDMNGTYISNWDLISSNGASWGITQDGTYFWITDTLDDEVYKYYAQPQNAEWYYEGKFNVLNSKTSDFSTTLNTALNSGACNCEGCSLDGVNCTIPFLFHSDTAGILEYSAIDILYNSTQNVTLVSPENDSSVTSGQVFICNVSKALNLNNITLYIWNSTGDIYNQTTNSVSGTENETNFTIYFDYNDNMEWNCLSNDGEEAWAENNFTINVYMEYSKNITQPFSITDVTKRIGSFLRDMPQSFTIDSAISKLRSVFVSISQIINFMKAEKTYDFSGVFNSRAFNNTVAEEPPLSYSPAGETEMNYTQINASDDIYATDTSTDHPYHRFEMAIEETDVDYVDVLWEGHTSSIGIVYLYVWNYTANNWSLIDSGSGATDFNLTARLYDLTDIRQGVRNITFLVQDG